MGLYFDSIMTPEQLKLSFLKNKANSSTANTTQVGTQQDFSVPMSREELQLSFLNNIANDKLTKIESPSFEQAMGVNPNATFENNRNKQLNINESGTSTPGGTPGVNRSYLFDYAGKAMDIASGLIDRKHDDTGFNEQQQIGNLLTQSSNPYAKLAGVAYKGLSILGEATGTNSSKLTDNQADAIGLNGFAKTMNNIGSFIPMAGMFSSETPDAEMSMTTKQYSGAYSGTANDINTGSSMSGKRYLFGSNRASDFINENNRRNELITQIGNVNTLRKSNSYTPSTNYSGTNNVTAVGKQGLKLMTLAEAHKLLVSRPTQNAPKTDVAKFRDGGVIGVDSNVLPEGALHKELNHMEDYNEKLDKEITDKGIAVVTTDSEGKPKQVAEIECEELIFRKSVTEKLEELWNKWKDTEDDSKKAEYALRAGILLSKEIITNTDDNTGDFLENGDN
jgi:hypothetical protein